jgi:predicted TIM-barrel fold metal-dependent hydrolase
VTVTQPANLNRAGMPIDILGHLFTPEALRSHFLGDAEERGVFEGLGRADNLKGYTPKELMAYADEVGVGRIHVASFASWSYRHQRPYLTVTADEVHEVIKQTPGYAYGLFGINPHTALAGVRELERSVRELNFVGAHVHPHGFDLGPDHAFYYPFYAKCAELGVPLVVSMGHTLDFMPIENGRPARLDRVALYFPELKIVCAHTGWPWVEEAIALASKHPNVFLGTTAYAPRYWKPEMVHFINSWGQDKVVWGTDFPLLSHREVFTQLEALGLRDGPRRKLLWENAERLFRYT